MICLKVKNRFLSFQGMFAAINIQQILILFISGRNIEFKINLKNS